MSIEARGISKRFGSFRALNDVSVVVNHGELIAPASAATSSQRDANTFRPIPWGSGLCGSMIRLETCTRTGEGTL
jgi:hypothetical protein